MITLDQRKAQNLKKYINSQILSQLDFTNYIRRFENLPDGLYDENLYLTCRQLLQEYMNPIKIEDEKKVSVETKDWTGFSDSFLQSYASFFQEPRYTIGGHGTTKENALQIMEQGLYGYGHFWKNMLDLHPTMRSLERLKDWPHKKYKNIVIFDLPPLDVCPVWKKISGNKENLAYHISNQYVRGYLDLEEERFIPNPHYRSHYEYEPTHNVFDMLDHSSSERFIDEGNIGRLYDTLSYVIASMDVSYHNQFTNREYRFLLKEVQDIIQKIHYQINLYYESMKDHSHTR